MFLIQIIIQILKKTLLYFIRNYVISCRGITSQVNDLHKRRQERDVNIL